MECEGKVKDGHMDMKGTERKVRKWKGKERQEREGKKGKERKCKEGVERKVRQGSKKQPRGRQPHNLEEARHQTKSALGVRPSWSSVCHCLSLSVTALVSALQFAVH